MKNMINIARTIARIAHAGQTYGGVNNDYFEQHIMDVVRRVENAENAMFIHVSIAYLHDTVEDTAVTLADLHEFGFGDDVVTAIAAISRRKGESYLDEYIPRVKENELAAFVKYHDLQSNTNTRTPESLARRNLEAMRILNH